VKLKSILKLGLYLVGITAAGYVLLVSFLIFGPSVKSYFQQTSFDSVQWKASLETGDTIKQRMVSNLLSQHKLVGMRVEEIDQLLGRPHETSYFKDYDYLYWLGPERTMGVDSEWLGIKFKSGITVKADLLRD
jgi:hypothetical protein